MDPLDTTSIPATHLELIALQKASFNTRLRGGEVEAYVHPLGSISNLLLLVYFAIPWPRYSRTVQRLGRAAFFVATIWIIAWVQWHARSPHKAVDFGIGLLNAWSICQLFTLLVFTDPQGEAKRIRLGLPGEGGEADEADEAKTSSLLKDDGKETVQNGHRNKKDDGEGLRHRAITSSPEERRLANKEAADKQVLFMQGYPLTAPLLSRLSWSFDLINDFRGIGWSHCIPHMPALPSPIRSALSTRSVYPSQPSLSACSPTTGPTGVYRYPTRASLVRGRLAIWLFYYLALDAVKVVMMYDPHFWGFVDPSPPPPTSYPSLITSSPRLTHTYRMLLSGAGVYFALNTIFTSGPLIQLLILAPRASPATSPQNVAVAPWMYPTVFGSFANISRNGLAGFWGAFWHQVFRRSFAAPSRWLVERLGLDHKGQSMRLLQLLVAFGMSGFLHAAGSQTMWPATKPVRGPIMFFLAQAVGIVVQTALVKEVKRKRVEVAGWVGKAGNWVFVFVWMYLTSHLLTDDFARGGIWLFEPVPVSVVRWLGYGLPEEGFVVWKRPAIKWHVGDRWWKCGIAV